jgi:hypothetical protein
VFDYSISFLDLSKSPPVTKSKIENPKPNKCYTAKFVKTDGVGF